MKVVIVGSGISGLTVAHYLNEKGFDVEVYEKNNIAGGMARSLRDNNGVPTEHSWRGYAPFYYNLFNLIKKIPLDSEINQKVIQIDKVNHDNIEDTPSLENKFGKDEISTTREISNVNFNEINKHKSKSSLWTVYKGKVYDVTHFIDMHPGGEKLILRSAGKDIEEVWKKNNIFHLHGKNTRVLRNLKKNLVGNLIEEIVLENEKKSVYDNLNSNKLEFKLLFDNERRTVSLSSLTPKDKLFLFVLFSRVIISNRRREKYFEIRLDPILKKNLSKNGYHFLVDFISGPGYGFDKNSMSLGHFALFAFYAYREKEPLWKVMNKPTSEAWIDPWVNYLKKKGVKFYFNYELKSIDFDSVLYNDNNIHTIQNLLMVSHNLVDGKKDYTFFPVSGDFYCIAINPFNLESVLEKSFNTFRSSQVKGVMNLINKFSSGNLVNNQISFRLGFSKKLKLPKINFGFVLVDSQYNITFYDQADHWKIDGKAPYLGKIDDQPILSLFSGTIIQPYNKGGLYGKSALELSKKELIKEIIYQFKKCKQFNNLINKMNSFNSAEFYDSIIFTEIFEDWEEKKYDNTIYLKSKNLKYVNNSINEKYRLDQHYPFLTNLFFSGGHTKNSVKIWSMEGSVESGILTTNEILRKYNKLISNSDRKTLNYVDRYCHETDGNEIFPYYNRLLIILKKLDNLFYKIELPNIVDILLVFFILYFVIDPILVNLLF